MLEHYFVKPSTIDKIRTRWLGTQIESYVEWMEVHGCARPTVHRRVPLLFYSAEFLQKRGCTEIASAFAFVEEFVSLWLSQHTPEAKSAESLRKHRIFDESAVLQMLRLACEGHARRNRHRRSFPFESAVPGFAEYLRSECGFRRTRYQQGSVQREKRQSGADVWVFRWWEPAFDGTSKRRKAIVGTVEAFPTEAFALKAAKALRIDANQQTPHFDGGPKTVAELVAHYRLKELVGEN